MSYLIICQYFFNISLSLSSLHLPYSTFRTTLLENLFIHPFFTCSNHFNLCAIRKPILPSLGYDLCVNSRFNSCHVRYITEFELQILCLSPTQPEPLNSRIYLQNFSLSLILSCAFSIKIISST